jgi:hypothetical protein
MRRLQRCQLRNREAQLRQVHHRHQHMLSAWEPCAEGRERFWWDEALCENAERLQPRFAGRARE